MSRRKDKVSAEVLERALQAIRDDRPDHAEVEEFAAALVDGILHSTRHDGSSWSVWLRPPGADRHLTYVPIATELLIDRRGNGHMVTEEESRGLIYEHHLVDWVTPSGTARIQAPEIQQPHADY